MSAVVSFSDLDAAAAAPKEWPSANVTYREAVCDGCKAETVCRYDGCADLCGECGEWDAEDIPAAIRVRLGAGYKALVAAHEAVVRACCVWRLAPEDNRAAEGDAITEACRAYLAALDSGVSFDEKALFDFDVNDLATAIMAEYGLTPENVKPQ